MFSLRHLIGIRHSNFFDISFPLWFYWRIQVASKIYYGNNLCLFFFWKRKYFSCITLSPFTLTVATLANALKCKLSSIKHVVLNHYHMVIASNF